MNNKIIAVTGATGQQGNAVAKKLLADGWKVRALTRDAGKPATQELGSLGAEPVAGDMENRSELEAAFEGAYGVFSVQNFWLPNVGFEGEIRQGKNVADAAKAAGVEQLVFSSVGSAHRGMGQKHFESKWIIEQYIQSLNIPYTILRPVAFFENFNWERTNILNGTFNAMGLRSEKERQLIAVEDIAAFVALALANPEQYLGRTIELAGDALTESQIGETFAKVIGRPVALTLPSGDLSYVSEEEMTAMLNFFNGKAYDADITTLRKLHPGLLTLEAYLRKNGWENAEPIPAGQNAWGS
ncbi:MAG TPA: NmrA/HSCARG family protein [Anaerolineales bacterium]|nr:NmrA/HSCARG family protein [Anaerolineales bacterium]